LGVKKNTSHLLFAFVAIILFLFAITFWWLSLANENLQIWSIIFFFFTVLLMFSLIIIFLFDVQKRIEKLELIYRIKDIEGDSPLKNIDIKIVSLSNWEKRIINLLKEKGGELTQSELKSQTGLSRSNMSKNINSLQQKNIIRKEPFKRTNRIILIKNILD